MITSINIFQLAKYTDDIKHEKLKGGRVSHSGTYNI